MRGTFWCEQQQEGQLRDVLGQSPPITLPANVCGALVLLAGFLLYFSPLVLKMKLWSCQR